MNSFEFTVKNTEGIHACSAGIVTKAPKSLGGGLTTIKGEKVVDVQKLLAFVIRLGSVNSHTSILVRRLICMPISEALTTWFL